MEKRTIELLKRATAWCGRHAVPTDARELILDLIVEIESLSYRPSELDDTFSSPCLEGALSKKIAKQIIESMERIIAKP